MKKNKFKTVSAKKNAKFTANKGYENLYPSFSFKNYICSDDYFSKEHSNEKRHSLYNFLLNIKDFSNITWGEMKQDPKQYHFHQVLENLSVLKDYSEVDLDQFKIKGMKQGRFIGFFDELNIFNILIYDSKHQTYPRK